MAESYTNKLKDVLEKYGNITYFVSNRVHYVCMVDLHGRRLTAFGSSETKAMNKAIRQIKIMMWRRVTGIFWLSKPLP